jgi:hypothetical protein
MFSKLASLEAIATATAGAKAMSRSSVAPSQDDSKHLQSKWIENGEVLKDASHETVSYSKGPETAQVGKAMTRATPTPRTWKASRPNR